MSGYDELVPVCVYYLVRLAVILLRCENVLLGQVSLFDIIDCKFVVVGISTNKLVHV